MKLKKNVSGKKTRISGVELTTHLRLPKILRPKFADTLVFPEDLTDLDSANISDLLSKYTLLASLVQQDIAELTRTVLACETEDKRRRNKILRSRPQLQHIEKNKRENIFDTDEHIESLYFGKMNAVMKRTHSEAFLAIYERYISALSRELTRKGMEEGRAMSSHMRQRG